MDFSYRPRITGRGGAHVIYVPVALGTLTANQTTDFAIPVGYGKFYVLGASYQAEVAAADADGTLVGVLKKYRASDDTEVTISSNFDLETVTVKESNPLTVNGGDAARTLQRADTLRFEVTNNSVGIDTQHAQAFLVVELAVLE